MKAFISAVLAILGVGCLAGCGGYSRTVDKTPAQVAVSLADLDISKDVPGGVKTDPAESGGVKPDFRLDQAPDRLTWFVMSGEKVAMRMTAILEPIEGGTKTRVTTQVERGDAPDDLVSPAFRSTGLTLGLFSMAVETNLDRLTKPRMASAAVCEELIRKFETTPADWTPPPQSENLKEAVGETSRSIFKLGQMQQELRRNGCPMGFTGPTNEVKNRMGSLPSFSSGPRDDRGFRDENKDSGRPQNFGQPMAEQ